MTAHQIKMVCLEDLVAANHPYRGVERNQFAALHQFISGNVLAELYPTVVFV